MSRVPSASEARATRISSGSLGADRTSSRSFALGWIALAPLFLVYELALSAEPASSRNVAEVLATRALAILPFDADLARRTLLAGLAVLALAALVRHERAILRGLFRVLLEGLAAAIVLGPLLYAALAALGLVAPRSGAPAAAPEATPVALLAGGAAWEELLFRVGLLAALVALARRAFRPEARGSTFARTFAEALAIALSSALFAAAHLETVLAPLGGGGEPYDGARFAWRFAAGLALAILYRWRGMGVAAWTHAFFNLALALGAGAEVLVS